MPEISLMNIFRECHRGKHIYSEMILILANLSLIKLKMIVSACN